MIFSGLFRRRRYFRFTRHLAGAIRQRVLRGVLLLITLFLLHILAMMHFEGLQLGDAAWLTITTATTVGYGDMSASSLGGRLATTLCMYVFGIFLLAQVVTDFFEHRILQRERRRCGLMSWTNMKDHLLIINTPTNNAETYLPRLVGQIRSTPELDDIPIQLLTTRFPDGLPAELVNTGVTHFSGIGENSDALRAANVDSAAYIILIAELSHDPRSDALTFDVLSRIRDIGSNATIVAEVVDDVNRERILRVGATTVVRPVRAYPELAIRALIEPGTEQVMENLFTHEADRLARFDASFNNLRWQDVVVSFVTGGGGVPMGYIDAEGVHTNPQADKMCSGQSIITLVNDSLNVTAETISACLQKA